MIEYRCYLCAIACKIILEWGTLMESICLLHRQKKAVEEFFNGDELSERPNAFTDLQDDAIHAIKNVGKSIWSASFVRDASKSWKDF